jgi:hypothetical protein
MGVVSPCVAVCIVDPESGYCRGCKRTLTEVAEWLLYTDDEKRAILAELEKRKVSAA